MGVFLRMSLFLGDYSMAIDTVKFCELQINTSVTETMSPCSQAIMPPVLTIEIGRIETV